MATNACNADMASALCTTAYALGQGQFDEMWRSDGELRQHWQPFLQALNKMGCEEFERRHREAIHLVRENGSTYNIHGDVDYEQRTWHINPIPLILNTTEWSFIKDSLAQRAHLLNLILKDLYGEQRLVREGFLPAELVYGQNGFLRSCAAPAADAAPGLTVYAADLARGSDGHFRVLSDVAQTPSGIGYALETRTTMARILPELIRHCPIHRLSTFFRNLQGRLAALAPLAKPHLRTVLLTPGAQSENYFEHAYLAAYLGYTLVRGNDLTVRDGFVWLKSLEGLEPVDVIFRHVLDGDCDPLELRAGSNRGVPGLLEAWRRQNVVLVNPLGCGILENPGLLPYLPAIAQHMMGQALMLPSVATWWCGTPDGLQYVLDHLEELVVKSIHPAGESAPVFGTRLSRSELAALRSRLLAQPGLYVGQEKVVLSTTPSYHNGRLQALTAKFRVFASADDEHYQIMPGGIVRSASAEKREDNGEQAGGVVRDLWVMARAPQRHVSLWLQSGRRAKNLQRSTMLPSRAAENLYWVGRYAERTEAIARLLRIVFRYHFQSERYADQSEQRCLRHLLDVLATVTGVQPVDAGKKAKAQIEQRLQAVVLDFQQPGSLVSTLRAMTQAAHAVRERWSKDSWHVIDSIDKTWSQMPSPGSAYPHRLQQDMHELIIALMAFAGLSMESMTRESGWLMLDSGRRIERVIQFIELYRASLVRRLDHDMILEDLMLETVLTITENIITYRRRYRSYLQLETVVELLLLDETNPRSLAYLLKMLQEHIGQLPRQHQSHRLSPQERLILEASSRLRLSDPSLLVQSVEGKEIYPQLNNLLSKLLDLLTRVSDALSSTYFSHVRPSQQLIRMNP